MSRFFLNFRNEILCNSCGCLLPTRADERTHSVRALVAHLLHNILLFHNVVIDFCIIFIKLTLFSKTKNCFYVV
jgi:hypothetical protein